MAQRACAESSLRQLLGRSPFHHEGEGDVHIFGGQEYSAEDVEALSAYAHSLGIHPVKLIALMEAAGGTQFWDAAYKAKNQADDSRGQVGNQSVDQSIAS